MRYDLSALAVMAMTVGLWAQEPPASAELVEPEAVQEQPADPVPAPKPKPRATTIISGSGNGWGNKIVIDNSGCDRGTTVISGTRNGFGNRLIIVDGQVVHELPAVPGGRVAVRPAVPAAVDAEVMSWLWFYHPEAAAAYREAMRWSEIGEREADVP